MEEDIKKIQENDIDIVLRMVVLPMKFGEGEPGHPLLLVQVKPAEDLRDEEKRRYADAEIRERMCLFKDQMEVPKLYGISAFGRQCAYYTYERETDVVLPEATTAVPPIDRWTDVMKDEGRDKFKAMVDDIRVMVPQVEVAAVPEPEKGKHCALQRVWY